MRQLHNFLVAILVLAILMLVGASTVKAVDMEPKFYGGPVQLLGPVVNVNTVGAFQIGGTAVTGTGAQINQAVANAGAVNVPKGALTNVLTSTGVGVTLAAFNGAALTNLTAANIAGGTLSGMTLASGTELGANNGSALTNLTAANIAGGTLSGMTLASGTVLGANNGSALTNLTAANIAGNIPVETITNALGGLASCIITNVVWDNGATTGNWTFVNGILTARSP